jgi:hypothetical protein
MRHDQLAFLRQRRSGEFAMGKLMLPRQLPIGANAK